MSARHTPPNKRRTPRRRPAARSRRTLSFGGALLASALVGAPSANAQRRTAGPEFVSTADSMVDVRLVDVDLRVAVQALGRYLDRPVLVGTPTLPGAPAPRVTLETARGVPRAAVPRLLRGLVEAQGWELVTDSVAGLYRVRPKEVPRPAAPDPVAPAGSPMFPGGAAPGGPELFVIRLRHARAADVAATVNALYGRSSALGEPGARGYAPTLGQQLGPTAVAPFVPGQPSAGTPAGNAAAGVAQPVAGAAGRTAAFAGEVTIIPDAGTNALLVRASRADADLVQAAVRELDVRPLQVLIEVVIAEVSRTRSFDFGVESTVPQTPVQGVSGVNSVTVGGATTPTLGLGDFALRIMKAAGAIQFDATLRAAAARGDARILSRPVVLATNNEAAEILVGSQQPFVQVSRALPTDNAARDQVVQYREVGTKLVVKPTISGDGFVSIAVTQEVSSATAEVQFGAPVISTRTVQTVLLVRDSQTVVLGGLADRERQATQSGIPVLSSIPLVGGLFGHASRQSTETEFFLFLTPRIIRTDADAEAVTRPLERRSGAARP
ncbi:hypothetical protein tb265_50050 [Gemmatimonadetes bacterium T265]|nr:hypothetical protein tb265_50050 [Gemmatimonadetes bacterium T265]